VSTSSAATSLVSSGNLRPAGVLGGGQIGANHEFVPWVVGIEGSWTDSTISGSTLIGCSTCPKLGTLLTPVLQERFTSHALWFAALTGRPAMRPMTGCFMPKPAAPGRRKLHRRSSHKRRYYQRLPGHQRQPHRLYRWRGDRIRPGGKSIGQDRI
jgi:hypothetical protein